MDDQTWVVAPPSAAAEAIASALDIPLPIAQVLVNRKIDDVETARRFLHGTLGDCPDPFLFKDMTAAVERIGAAIAGREKILIFGDYDVDGVLSTVMLHKALATLGADVEYFIPDRLKDGYGIKDEHLDIILERGARLVISVDCGIRAGGFAARAAAAGIGLIVTDHHRAGQDLPSADAVLDPVVEGSGYPDRALAGVGVVFKLIQALYERSGRSRSLPHFLKLVAIGTISDVADLRGENRLLVKRGLEELRAVSNVGLRSLLDVCGLAGRKVSEGDIAFRIGPRINAAGRMGYADLAVRLFFARAEEETRELARRLDELNSRRQQTEDRIFKQASERVRERELDKRYKLLILGSEEWHRGVVGIVASRIKDAFNRPVILFSYEDGKAVGSGRSIADFSLIDCLEECRGLFSTFGGHTYAVGCTLPRESVPAFRETANAVAERRLTLEQLQKKLRVDTFLDFAAMDGRFFDAYGLLSPFGVGNPRPVFGTEKAEVTAGPQTLKDKHLKLWLRQGDRTFEAVAWDHLAWADRVGKGARLDVAYTLLFSHFQGKERLQLQLEGIRT